MSEIDVVCEYFRHLGMTHEIAQKILNAGFQFRIESNCMMQNEKQFGNGSGFFESLHGGMHSLNHGVHKVIICDDAQRYVDIRNIKYPPEKIILLAKMGGV